MSGNEGYSKPSLFQKLGLKAGDSCLFHQTIDGFEGLITPIIDKLNVLAGFEYASADFIIHFARSQTELEKNLGDFLPCLKKDGMLWICWPKGVSKIPTDLNRDFIRNYILNIGLVDVKIAAIDENWSGLKFVYRLKDR